MSEMHRIEHYCSTVLVTLLVEYRTVVLYHNEQYFCTVLYNNTVQHQYSTGKPVRKTFINKQLINGIMYHRVNAPLLPLNIRLTVDSHLIRSGT